MTYNNIVLWKTILLRNISLALLFLFLITTVQAQLPQKIHSKSPLLGNHYNPDGMLKMNEGFAGDVDTKRPPIEMANESSSQSQLFSSSSLSTPYIWDTQFATNGLNDDVYAIAMNGNDIYVGGDFTTAGGDTVNFIAKWDGTSWSSLGGGMNGTIFALAMDGDTLYAGGFFTTAGGVPANRIAKWDGTNWSSLGDGTDGGVYSIAFSGTDIYAGGGFITAGGVTANGIAKWNGTTWSALGSGMDLAVFSVATIGSTLYAGGPFTSAGGTSVNYIAKWNGATWSPLGSGVSYWVQALLADNTTLYVGGDFGNAGGIYSPGIARWNGTTWSAIGSGINSTVRSLSVQGGKLYAGGWQVYVWDGGTWSTNGNSPNNLIHSLAAAINDTIYAGGSFTSTANTPSLHFGRCYPASKALAIEEHGSWWFGNIAIGNHLTMNMKIYNTGVAENLSITSVSSSLPDFTISPTSASIAPGDSFAFQITFSPLSEGDISSSLIFTHDAYNSPSSVTVTGTGLPAPPPKYYRTARYEDWANSVDIKGKRVSVKRKTDKVFFKFNLIADSARPLKMDFGMVVNACLTRGKSKLDTLAVITDLKKLTDSLLTVSAGETLQVEGIGNAGKKIVVKYQWGKKKAVTMKDELLYKLNQPGLPMPNLHNVGEELFPKGFGNPGPYFASGLIIGRPAGIRSPNTVLLKKYGDIQKSFVKAIKNGIRLHSDTLDARCLDSLDGTKKKAMTSQLTALPPDKQDNKLFAEAVTLKLNIAASASEKFPSGFGELRYNNPDDTTSPFNGVSVATISEIADYLLSCQTYEPFPTATLQELYEVIRSVNVAFADSPYTIDTLSFATKTKLTGLKTVSAVNYLYETPGIEPRIIFAKDYSVGDLPEEFTLQQNYPNPFNPSTTISFDLPNDALVTLKVYDVIGREVTVLLDNQLYEAGNHESIFDASTLASGLYFYRISAQSTDGKSFSDVKKMILIR